MSLIIDTPRLILALTTVLFCLSAQVAHSQDSSTDGETAKIDFTKQVKPILSNNCFVCHGPDAAQRSSGLRLDVQESSTSDLGGYFAIVPGDPDSSELVERILSDDPDLVMPPADHLKQLTKDQKQILVRWIEEGANWSTHWAFAPPQKHEPNTNHTNEPNTASTNTANPKSANFIDAFLQERLVREGIEPAAPAADHTLMRRLSFDLTGLPPKYKTVQQFSSKEKSYDETVDELLASPHFGERMAVYWLDLVRYADSVGYHGDQPVSVTPYRDYVVEAFNSNLSFDQFTKEQLAGDLLENPTQSQLIASGYNRLGMMSAEGGVQPEEYLAKYAADRVRTTASVWLGVTLGCAECHDHKFDPFTTKEFYEFGAFFADIKERGLYSGPDKDGRWGPQVDVPNLQRASLLQPIDAELEELKAKLVEISQMEQERLDWERSLQEERFDWIPLEPTGFLSANKIEAEIGDDHILKIVGDNSGSPTYAVTVKLPTKANDGDAIKAFRLEVLSDETLPSKGPGRAGNGNFVLTELLALNGDQRSEFQTLKRRWKNWPETLRLKSIQLKNPTASIEQASGADRHPDKKWSAKSTIDKDKKEGIWGWAILPEAGKDNELVVQVDDPSTLSDEVTFVLQHKYGDKHTIGKFRISASTSGSATADPVRLLTEDIRAALAIDQGKRTPEQDKIIVDHYIAVAAAFTDIRNRITDLEKRRAKVFSDNTRTSLVSFAVAPREMRVLGRGNWMDKTGEVVQPGVPASIAEQTWKERATREDLAQWITSKDNPLTARVYVNRLWRMYFGAGLSNVLDDLGSQGEPPSHPELLDRLAVEFVESGWDVKHMVRLMVTSKAYRQSSRYRDDLKVVDPENRLVSRQARFRLDAEFIRDNSLSVSGLLVDDIGGRSGKPYQPAGLYRHLNFPKRSYQAGSGKDQYRRGLYTHWQRQFLHPAMKTFDAPAREECTAARARSSTPLAALVMLNDPSYVEAARVLADKAMSHSETTTGRIQHVFQLALSRDITRDEQEVLSDLYEDHLKHFADHEAEAKAILEIGLSKSKSTFKVAERAAWTSVCRAIMNMHEFVLRK